MLLRLFLMVPFLALGTMAQACALVQFPSERVVEMQRQRLENNCFIDLQHRVMWFNRREIPVDHIEVVVAPRRGTIKIRRSRYVDYFPSNAWADGEDSFVVQFYLAGRLQQITVRVGIFRDQI